jgi:hypothetical protein
VLAPLARPYLLDSGADSVNSPHVQDAVVHAREARSGSILACARRAYRKAQAICRRGFRNGGVRNKALHKENYFGTQRCSEDTAPHRRYRLFD